MTDLQMLKSYHYKFTGTGPCQKVDVFSTPDKIFWGAFFGDVEHEVRPSPVQRRCAGGACWVTSCDTEHSDPLRAFSSREGFEGSRVRGCKGIQSICATWSNPTLCRTERLQVLSVTEGHRITLTYVLHRTMDASYNPTADLLLLRASKLHEALCQALACKDFMPDGGRLGFRCRHLYEETQLAQVWYRAHHRTMARL
eukprot:607556-Prorocentrum_minimum.AAC.1